MFPQKPAYEFIEQLCKLIAKTWKQCECPSLGEWINKVWCIRVNGILLNNKNEPSDTGKEATDESQMQKLSEKNLNQKAVCYMLPFL